MATSTLMTFTIFLKKIYNSVLMKVLHLLNYHVLELTAIYVNVAIKTVPNKRWLKQALYKMKLRIKITGKITKMLYEKLK